MSQYKNVLSCYVNTNDKGEYLTITNVSKEPIIIEPGKKVFLNKTRADIKEKYPNIPDYSKSVKIEENTPKQTVNPDDMPF